MANFTLKLLVPNNDSDKNIVIGKNIEEHFLSTLITSFDSQLDEYNINKEKLKLYNEGSSQGSLFTNHSISYTYNEKFTKHKNGQKELTFDLDDKYLTDSTWELNPYARVLHVGTLFELTDKYKNVYLFIITKVVPNFTNLNIKYSYTCQDLFTYQLSRQNTGYQLINDETSADFIGALGIDDWATTIVKECYINYTYVPLNAGVIMTDSGAIMQYKGILDSNNVEKVIKKQYNAISNPELFETVPFSVNGSSAAAALISLADIYGMQLQVVEGYNEEFPNHDVYNYFFWFEPLKNEDVSGLMYSPKREVQSFGMSFSGDALTTVLNVNSTTWEDEEIGLFPSVPSFFINLFASNSWDQSIYEPGFFKRAVQGEYRTDLDLGTPALSGGVVTVPIQNTGWKTYYNKIQFVWDDKHYLILKVNNTRYDPFNTVFKIQIDKNDEEGHSRVYTYIAGDEIPSSLLEGYNSISLVFNCDITGTITIDIEENYYILTRNYTQEEIAFAEIAEKLPWLENKLIDFSYFLKQGIISRNEYESIQNELTNTVRIINGKLMCYASAHFNAIHKQVNTLSGIQVAADALGAAFDAEVVQSYAETGKPINNFSGYETAYQSFFNADVEEKEPLYEFNNNISFLFNRYFQAEQRVLRNLYEFKRFFEERNAFASNSLAIMEEVTYSINAAGGSNILKDSVNQKFYLYSFDNELQFNKLSVSNIESLVNNNEPFVDFYEYSNGVYKQVIVPSPYTLSQGNGQILIPDIKQDQIITETTDTIPYSEDYYYYLSTTDYTSNFGTVPENRTFTIDDADYVRLTLLELKKLHIKYQKNNNGPTYYLRDEQYYIAYRNNVWSSTMDGGINKVMQAFAPYMLPLSNKLNGFIKDLKKTWFTIPLSDTAWNFYKSCMPIDNLMIEDYNFALIDNNLQILDEHNNAYKYDNTHFLKYNRETKLYEQIAVADLYKTRYYIPFLTANSSVQSLLIDLNDSTITAAGVLTLLNSFANQVKEANQKYYTCTVDNTALGWATAGIVNYGGIVGIPLAILLNVYGRKEFSSWTQSDRPDFSMTYWDGSEWAQDENTKESYKCSKTTSEISNKHKGDNTIPNYLKEADSDLSITMLTDKLLGCSYYSTLQTDWKHYINYYSHIAATYSTEMNDENNKFKVLSRKATIVHLEENNNHQFKPELTYINPNETYYWVERKVLDDNGTAHRVVKLDKILSFTNKPYRFNATKWYPLVTNREKVDFTSLFTQEELIRNISLQELCDRINAMRGSSVPELSIAAETEDDLSSAGIAVLTFANSNSYYLVHDEPYEPRKIVLSSATGSEILWTDINTEKIYNESTHRILSLSDMVVPLIYGVKRQAKKDMSFREATLSDWPITDEVLVDDVHWYDANQERIYSIPQIKADNLYSNYSFLSGSTLKTIEFYNNNTVDKHFSPTINRFTCYYDEDSNLITDETVVVKDFSGENQLTCSASENTMIAVYGEAELEINRITDTQYDIGKMSNGEFWYAFHNRLDIPDLMQQSAVIETKLTENWSVAYNASLYSRWFVPRSWQINKDSNSNHFANLIWIVDKPDSGYAKVRLSTTIVPEIKIVSSNNNEQKDTILLNNYNLIYINSSDITSVDTEYVYIENSDLKDNPAFLETYKQIFGDEPINQNFVAQPYGKRTYYYVNLGGTTRMQAANKLTGGAAPSEWFDGLYGMQLHKLLSTYCHLKDSFYTKYLNKKIAFWRQLYRRYPGVFLENVYSNKDVRTSEQLYQMADLAMKDYTSPETQYNITTIDVLSLEGYKGQELNIGNSILLNASDYYTDVDETFRALNQYLFITDISYSLRQDTDISLTVNTIKYQDKLIQSLVKLIR